MPYWYGIMFVGMMWMFHLLQLYHLVMIIGILHSGSQFADVVRTNMGTVVLFVICIGPVLITMWRYLRVKRYEDLSSLWKEEEAGVHRRRSWIVLAYGLLNLLLFAFIVILRSYVTKL